MILLVAEKPSVANQHYKPMLERIEGESFRTKDGALIGKSHCITWCIGHLVTLSPMDSYDETAGSWKLSNLPLLPEKFKLMAIESTKRQLEIVKNLMLTADVIVNGADAGREGNLIFDLILDFFPELKKKTLKRLWVNSYVAKDLDKAWKNLEDASFRQNLSYAARLRQRADWMVGLNATRAYTLTVGRGKVISVGRVQTPTLNLVVERDKIIEEFKEFFHYSVLATWASYKAQLLKKESDTSKNLKVATFEQESSAQAILDKCKSKSACVQSVSVQEKRQFPPKPFDLTELQKEGNKRFKYSAKQILDIAQNLYEKKFITYPRTDSEYLPDSMKDEAYALAKRLIDKDKIELMRAPNENFVFINKDKVTDHFAIIPTGEIPRELPENEQKIYALIKERFTFAWLKPYIYSEMEVILRAPQELDSSNGAELFRLKLKKIEDEGFKVLLKDIKGKGQNKNNPTELSKDEKDVSNAEDIENTVEVFPSIQEGDFAPFDDLEIQKKKKSKPKYYTEATLLSAMKSAGRQIENEELADAMKERGLGTPATQAGIIETLKKRGFIEAKKNCLISTLRGREVIALMDNKVKSPEMTGEWEYRLSQVEKGALNPKSFKDGIVEYVKQLFNDLKLRYAAQFERENVTECIACPKCKNTLETTPWGYICKNENCDFKISNTIAGKILYHAEMKTLLEKKELKNIDGFTSKKGTPFSANLILNDDFQVVFSFDEALNKTPTDYICPKCKKKLFQSKSRLICEEPCNFIFYKTMAKRSFSDDEIKELFQNGETSVLCGFKNKQDIAFKAKVKWNAKGEASFVFENDGNFHGKVTKFKCPCCNNFLEENKVAFFCVNKTSEKPCHFTLFKTIAQKKLLLKDIKTLLEGGETELLEDLKNKNGDLFEASLKLDESFHIAFKFPKRNFPCPVCNDMLFKREGEYKCASCGFFIPQIFYGRKFKDKEVESLLKNKYTPVLEPFKKNKTVFKAALEIKDSKKLSFNKLTVEIINK